jgi:hypothetical protein
MRAAGLVRTYQQEKVKWRESGKLFRGKEKIVGRTRRTVAWCELRRDVETGVDAPAHEVVGGLWVNAGETIESRPTRGFPCVVGEGLVVSGLIPSPVESLPGCGRWKDEREWGLYETERKFCGVREVVEEKAIHST